MGVVGGVALAVALLEVVVGEEEGVVGDSGKVEGAGHSEAEVGGEEEEEVCCVCHCSMGASCHCLHVISLQMWTL